MPEAVQNVFILGALFALIMQIWVNRAQNRHISRLERRLNNQSRDINKIEALSLMANGRIDVVRETLSTLVLKRTRPMSINHEDYSVEELLAAINHSLTMGGKMTAGNFAFQLLCDKLGMDRDEIEDGYQPDWTRKNRTEFGENS